MNPNIIKNRKLHKVISTRSLSDTTFVVRFERNNLSFQPGQHLYVGTSNSIHMREYSIYSGVHRDYLEILVKEIPRGFISPQLRRLGKGDNLYISGPYGMFQIFEDIRQTPLVFIATGTGIAPFHCFVHSHTGLDYTLIHGTRSRSESYELKSYEDTRLIRCITRDKTGHFQGRVTRFIIEHSIPEQSSVFLCGNSDMIYEAYDILQKKGIPRGRIFAEVYF